MAKIEFPKAIRALDLGEYAPELKGQMFYVWVNPTRAVLAGYTDASKTAEDSLRDLSKRRDAAVRDFEAEHERAATYGERRSLILEVEDQATDLQAALDAAVLPLKEFYSTVLSQHEDADTHISVADIDELIDDSSETDPGFYDWLTQKIVILIGTHRGELKKVSRGRSIG